MASAKARAQEAEVSRTLLGCTQAYGASWWRAWDALQWSPVGLFDGVPYQGGERLILAVLSLARGYGDRRWATEEDLESHGYQKRRNGRGVLLTAAYGRGRRLVFNADCVVRVREKGVRHGAPAPDDRSRRELDERTVIRLASALAACGTWPVRRGPCGHATYLAETAEVAVPDRAGWGRTPADLRELLETLAHANLCRRCPPGSLPNGSGALPLVATLASVMALSDLGVAPSDACRAEGEADMQAAATQAMRELAGELPRLMACADEAEKVAARLGEALANLSTDLVVDGCEEDVEPAGQDDEGAKEKRPAPTEAPYVRPPLRKPTIAAFGRYTLRDVVAESERASAALSRATGARG